MPFHASPPQCAGPGWIASRDRSRGRASGEGLQPSVRAPAAPRLGGVTSQGPPSGWLCGSMRFMGSGCGHVWERAGPYSLAALIDRPLPAAVRNLCFRAGEAPQSN